MVAVVAASVLLVAAAIGQLVLPFSGALLWLAFLAAIAMLWLRAVIHLGLLQEAAEIAIGPDVTCPNCGRSTPAHSFCGQCGISFRATAKLDARPPVADVTRGPATPADGASTR